MDPTGHATKKLGNKFNLLTKGLNFIKGYEGFHKKVFDANPPKGDWTIGYGHKWVFADAKESME